MKRKRVWIAFMVGVLSFCTLLSACDLSHKHYFNDYGVCKQCQKDASVTLTKQNGVYLSEEVTLEAFNERQNYSYFKFTADGDYGITAEIEGIGSVVHSVELYSTEVAMMTGGMSTLTWQQPLNEGTTYYLRVKLSRGGKTRAKVTPIL